MNCEIKSAAEQYAIAQEQAEHALAMLRNDRRNERLIIRACRALRKCERRRMKIKMIVELTTP